MVLGVGSNVSGAGRKILGVFGELSSIGREVFVIGLGSYRKVLDIYTWKICLCCTHQTTCVWTWASYSLCWLAGNDFGHRMHSKGLGRIVLGVGREALGGGCVVSNCGREVSGAGGEILGVFDVFSVIGGDTFCDLGESSGFGREVMYACREKGDICREKHGSGRIAWDSCRKEAFIGSEAFDILGSDCADFTCTT